MECNIFEQETHLTISLALLDCFFFFLMGGATQIPKRRKSGLAMPDYLTIESKKPPRTHWHICNNAVHLLNEAKKLIILIYNEFEKYFVSQPALRPCCARCRTLKITQNNRFKYCIRFTKLLFRRQFSYCTMVILLSSLSLLSSLLIGMCKQVASPQHSIHLV